MKLQHSKIIFILLIAGLFTSCNSVKRVAEQDYLLTKNTIKVNNKVNYSEVLDNLMVQQPNSKIARVPLRLYIYNLARPNIDSILQEKIYNNPEKLAWKTKVLSRKQLDKDIQARINFNKWLKNTGESPVVIDKEKTEKSLNRLKAYYFNNGYFNVEGDFSIEKNENQRASVEYSITTKKPYILDSIHAKIASPVLDSLYQKIKKESLIKKGQQYNASNYINERERINSEFRNSGIYHFSQDYISFENDTINTGHKVLTDIIIPDRSIKIQDFTETEPFKIYKIKDVNIYTDQSFENKESKLTDSVSYKNFNLYSYNKMRYNPKAITDAVFITPGDIFRDINRVRSYRHLSELRVFKYPNISYTENPDTTLTANIFLTPKKKFVLGFSAEATQSNIQTIGLSANPSLTIRNLLKGAEILQLSARAAIGASRDAADNERNFFDITELGADLRLTIPRLFTPFNTDKIIPKYMFPKTNISISASSQTNIGLDKTTVNGVINYNWKATEQTTSSLDLFNAAYVRNLNVNNYFNVYSSSYTFLNQLAQQANFNFNDPVSQELEIPNETSQFIDEVIYNPNPNLNVNEDLLFEVANIEQRRIRLTENNLILATNFNWIKDSRESVTDRDFYKIRWKLESAGNLLSTISSVAGLEKNEAGNRELFGVAFSQYIKGEVEFIKHWRLKRKNSFAFRFFTGLAVPYGNSTSIPFTRSYFAGGPNDNRGWTAYDIGPGSSGGLLDFNEANFKLATNAEYRYNIFESFYGALFVDIGNIWNVFDDVESDILKFNGLKDLEELAIAMGTGFRYDFDFFVLRFDIGFKAHNPDYTIEQKWFRDFNFGNAVYNIGINYPF